MDCVSDDYCNRCDDGDNNNKSIRLVIKKKLYLVFRTVVMMLMIKTNIAYDINY